MTNSIFYAELGARIKKIREEKGLGLGELALALEISEKRMERIEGGKVIVRANTVLKLIGALGVSGNVLVGLD